MSRFDEDTSIMRLQVASTPILLRTPQLAPHTRARGIATGVLLGLIAWTAIIAVGVAAYRWLGH